MQFLTSLFGGTENIAVTAILALGFVLVLVVFGVWALKVLFKASTNFGRGRHHRLSVIDSVTVDPKRQLLIVRRDDVEHLILTGGPQDLLIETGIAVERTARVLRRPPAAAEAGVPAESDRPAVAPRATERPRDAARPLPRKSASLRHTGLMRPLNRVEPAVVPMTPDISEQTGIDSATTSPANDTSGQTKLGAGRNFGDPIKAEGN